MSKEKEIKEKFDVGKTTLALFEIYGLAGLLEMAARDMEGSDCDSQYADPIFSFASVVKEKAQFCLGQLEDFDAKVPSLRQYLSV